MRHVHGQPVHRATTYRRLARVMREEDEWPAKKARMVGRQCVDARQDYLWVFCKSLATVLCEKGSVVYGSWRGVEPSIRVIETFENLKGYHPALVAVVLIDLAKLGLVTRGSRTDLSKARAVDIDDRAYKKTRSNSRKGTPAHRVDIAGYGHISRSMACRWGKHHENKPVRAALVKLLADHKITPPEKPLREDAYVANAMNQSLDLYCKKRRQIPVQCRPCLDAINKSRKPTIHHHVDLRPNTEPTIDSDSIAETLADESFHDADAALGWENPRNQAVIDRITRSSRFQELPTTLQSELLRRANVDEYKARWIDALLKPS